MKKLFKVLGVVAICAAFAVVVYNQVNAKPENSILAKNIEALSQNEGGSTTNHCPNYDYVPNHYIECQEITIAVTCTTNGEITVNGKIFTGNYKRNKEYTVVYAKYNCSGFQEGACCDQNRVRIELVSAN